jgi:hypothetical protein
MAIVNGTYLRVLVGGSVINCETDSTFSSSVELDRTICKDSPDSTAVPGTLTWNISGSALLEGNPSNGFIDLLTSHQAKDLVAVQYRQNDPDAGGTFTISGNGYITEISASGATEESATFDFTIEGSGDYSF